jgi:manganese efflux pump family protein
VKQCSSPARIRAARAKTSWCREGSQNAYANYFYSAPLTWQLDYSRVGDGGKKTCRERFRGDYMILNLLVLGFVLSLDNFRTSIALGPLRLRWRRAGQVALMFGFWDGIAPLAGVLAGHYVGQAIGPIADYAGPIVLGMYGLYLLVQVLRTAAPEELDYRWSLFSLPLPLSLDNIVAGTSLGLLGFSPWLSAAVFGTITALMSFIGLQLGRAASDLLSGAALVIMAIVLALRLE